MFNDYKCTPCNKEKIDEWVKNNKEEVKCDKCGKPMTRKLGNRGLHGANKFRR